MTAPANNLILLSSPVLGTFIFLFSKVNSIVPSFSSTCSSSTNIPLSLISTFATLLDNS